MLCGVHANYLYHKRPGRCFVRWHQLTALAFAPILNVTVHALALGPFAPALRALKKRSAWDLVCVDVFDTVLTRAVGEPAAVYLLLGQRVRDLTGATVTPELFARARALAEKRARAHAPAPQDISLAGIYRELTLAYPELEPVKGELMNRELAVEAELARPVPGAAAFLEQARRRSQRLVFVSDMYLPEAFLQQRLQGAGLWRDEDRLFVSSACGRMKGREGALFAHVLQTTGARAEATMHVGNNWADDYVQARKQGLRAVYLPSANLNHFEETLENHRFENAGASSLMAGAARLARLAQPVANAHERALVDVAAGVGGPLLVGFLLWTLQRAQAQGIGRLYYLAREGQIMQSLANILCQRLGFQIDNRYLYVSRRSLNLALLDNFSHDDLLWALTHHHEQDLTKILARLSLQPTDIEAALETIGLSKATWTMALTDAQRESLLGLLGEAPCRTLIQQRSQVARARAEGYLRQVGMFDDVACGLVDSGGLGSQMRTLSRLRTNAGQTPVTGFAFYRDSEPRLPLNDFPTLHVYMRDVAAHAGHARVKGMWETIETLCSADHGTVAGYERHEDTFVVNLEPGRTERIAAWGLPKVHDTLRAFAEAMVLEPEPLRADAREALCATLRMFWNRPLPHEAAAWGAFPWEPEAGMAEGSLAKPMGPKQALGLLSQNTAYEQVWPAGAESRSPVFVRGTLKMGRSVPMPLRRLLRLGLGSLRGRKKTPGPR